MQTQRTTELVTFHRLQDEPVQNVELFERAWDECIELQVQGKDEWMGKALLALSALDRYEVAVMHGPRVVGAVIVAHDPWDAHVGPCMSVFTQYVLPEYRNAGISLALMREAVRITRASGVHVLAFTHRKAPWRYETIYRRVK